MNLSIIKDLCKKQRRDITDLAAAIGMSAQNLHRSIRLNQMQAKDLENIARSLGVSIVTFFDADVTLATAEVYENKGKQGFVAKTIQNVDQRAIGDNSLLKDYSAEVIRLQGELLAAKDEINALLKERLNHK